MSKFKTFAAFLFGVVIGGVGTWYYIKDKYAKQSEQDISSAKDAFHNRELLLLSELQELKQKLQPESDESESKPVVLSNGKIPDKGDVVAYARSKYMQYSPSIKSDFPKDEPKRNDIEAPYVITPEEFGELDGYTKVSLTYYADGILADENCVIIDNVEEIVGDALDHIGEIETDSVFCRSDPKRCDYEILQDLRRYADVRKQFPRNI